jgi:hypothetical protein
MDLGNHALGVSQAAKLALLRVALARQSPDVAADGRKLTLRRYILTDHPRELHDDEGGDEDGYRNGNHSAGEAKHLPGAL